MLGVHEILKFQPPPADRSWHSNISKRSSSIGQPLAKVLLTSSIRGHWQDAQIAAGVAADALADAAAASSAKDTDHDQGPSPWCDLLVSKADSKASGVSMPLRKRKSGISVPINHVFHLRFQAIKNIVHVSTYCLQDQHMELHLFHQLLFVHLMQQSPTTLQLVTNFVSFFLRLQNRWIWGRGKRIGDPGDPSWGLRVSEGSSEF